MKKALITGIAGFAGSHLAEYLLKRDFEVFGFFHPDHSTVNIRHLKDKLKVFACNVLDKKEVHDHLLAIGPDYVFHLAAFSSPATSFNNARETLENNIVGQINLLEALAATGSRARILIIGSADEYGNIEAKYLPANEATPLLPISPYAVSKVAQDLLGYQYFLNKKLAIVRVRPFNHIGPRQSTSFAIPSFAAQIAALEKAGGGTMEVGNLGNRRDFTDVRDTVRAYLLALQRGVLGEVYNIGSGIPVKIGDILKIMIGLARVKIKIKKVKSKVPPQDIKIIYCDFSKFKKQTGWEPTIPLLKTLSDTINFERNKLTIDN